MNKSPFATELVEILSKAVNNKMYGSVEVYFENGLITQVTQRIIKKIKSREKTSPVTESSSRVAQMDDKTQKIRGVVSSS